METIQQPNIYEHVRDLVNVYSTTFPTPKYSDELHNDLLERIETATLNAAYSIRDRLGEIKYNEPLRRGILHLLSECMSVLSIETQSGTYLYVSALMTELFSG